MHFFQTPATPIMEGIIDLHDYVFFYLIIILTFTFTVFISMIWDFFSCTYYPYWAEPVGEGRLSYFEFRYFSHHTNLEIIWTIIPSFILLCIAIPSFSMLYSMDDIADPDITIKAIGHQWYWSYEAGDLGDLNKDSNMLPDSELSDKNLRLLEVDNPLIIPTECTVRTIVTSSDVIHSWAVPNFGIKIDAIPGRLNQVGIYIKNPGIYYGQCSELCGVNHGFMPIVIHAETLPN